MLRPVSEAYQPARGQQQPPALREAPAQRAQDWCFVSRQQAQLSPLQVTGLQVRTALPQPSLKWLIFCLPEGNKS